MNIRLNNPVNPGKTLAKWEFYLQRNLAEKILQQLIPLEKNIQTGH
jgi:hypothetical protein